MKNIAHNHIEKQKMLERQIVCGIDEVGRGCLAGPVVTAVVILKSHRKNSLIKDSKLLDSQELEKAYAWLVKNSTFAVSIFDHRTIDRCNIYRATQLSMQRAYYQLCAVVPQTPHCVLVDAVKLELPCEVISIFKGEQASISIAAASIVAKVTRDRIMRRLALQFPHYMFDSHKGYATKTHYDALFEHGACPIHRDTFLKNYYQAIDMSNNQLELF